MRLGHTQRLTCDRVERGTAYLTDEDGNTAVLSASAAAPELPTAGTSVDVFVYTGAQGEALATFASPLVHCGQVAALKVVAEGAGGVFLDWGLDKHLLLPFAEQRRPLNVGQTESVWVYLDNSGRLAASSRLDHHLDERPTGFRPWQSVELLIYQRTDLGYKAVVDHRAIGLLYSSDVFHDVRPGMRSQAWIKRVREDGRLDLALQPPSRELVDPLSERVIAWLEAQGGVGHLTDHSSPDEIRREFQVSKKNYKRALSQLYKQRRIIIEPHAIRLAHADSDDPGEVVFPERD